MKLFVFLNQILKDFDDMLSPSTVFLLKQEHNA